MRKKKVLVVSDSAYPMGTTGFGMVAGKVIDELIAKGWHVDHFARNFKGDAKGREDIATIYVPPANDPNGVSYLSQICEWERPDLVMMCADPGSIKEWRRNVEVRRVPNLVYTPTEGAPICEPWSVALFEIVDTGGAIVTYTEFGKAAMLQAFPDKPKRPVEVLGHGVDHAPFRKYEAEEREKIRRALGWSDKFVVINVARNASRKYLPRLLKGARLAKEQVPNLHVYLHTAAFENYFLGGHNLTELVRNWGMTDYVNFHFGIKDGGRGIRYEGVGQGEKEIGLIDLYNAADLFVSTSGGEGWNLPMTEAAACGVPVATPMYAGGWEVAQDWAYGLEIDDYETIANGLEMALVHPEQVSRAIVELWDSLSTREFLAERALEHSTRWKWEPTVKRLVELAEELTTK